MSSSDHVRTHRKDAVREVQSPWVSRLVMLTLGVLVLGGIIASVLWISATSNVGEDFAILTACITFTVMICLMVVREFIRMGTR